LYEAARMASAETDDRIREKTPQKKTLKTFETKK